MCVYVFMCVWWPQGSSLIVLHIIYWGRVSHMNPDSLKLASFLGDSLSFLPPVWDHRWAATLDLPVIFMVLGNLNSVLMILHSKCLTHWATPPFETYPELLWEAVGGCGRPHGASRTPYLLGFLLFPYPWGLRHCDICHSALEWHLALKG